MLFSRMINSASYKYVRHAEIAYNDGSSSAESETVASERDVGKCQHPISRFSFTKDPV